MSYGERGSVGFATPAEKIFEVNAFAFSDISVFADPAELRTDVPATRFAQTFVRIVPLQHSRRINFSHCTVLAA